MKRLQKNRAAFTLVELLTVVIIIGFLAGMVAGTAPAVMRSVKSSAIRAEIQQLSMALEAYKAEYGEYPPDGSDPDLVEKHIKRCYPEAIDKSIYYGGKNNVKPSNVLYLFLGPHNADPTQPFVRSNNTTKGFFEFDKSRLQKDSWGGYEYLPSGATIPFNYLKARGATGSKGYHPFKVKDPNKDYYYYYPAYVDSNGKWYNSESYQISSAGLDDDWGNTDTVQIPSNGSGLNKATLDNVVNFGKKTIKDLLD